MMVRVMLILGLLVLVIAASVFWRTGPRSDIGAPASSPPSSVKPVGTSTLRHGDVPERRDPPRGPDLPMGPR